MANSIGVQEPIQKSNNNSAPGPAEQVTLGSISAGKMSYLDATAERDEIRFSIAKLNGKIKNDAYYGLYSVLSRDLRPTIHLNEGVSYTLNERLSVAFDAHQDFPRNGFSPQGVYATKPTYTEIGISSTYENTSVSATKSPGGNPFFSISHSFSMKGVPTSAEIGVVKGGRGQNVSVRLDFELDEYTKLGMGMYLNSRGPNVGLTFTKRFK